MLKASAEQLAKGFSTVRAVDGRFTHEPLGARSGFLGRHLWACGIFSRPLG